MFYTTISKDGFCYIPSVNVVDEAKIADVQGTVIEKQTITREFVARMIDFGPVVFEHKTAQDALDMAVEIYKKMPRYRRQLGFYTSTKTKDVAYYTNKYRTMSSKGVGTWESEIADKYL